MKLPERKEKRRKAGKKERTRVRKKKLIKYKQDKFATCFKTCGTGSLTKGVGGGCKGPQVPRLCEQTDRQTNRTGVLAGKKVDISMNVQFLLKTIISEYFE